MCVCVKGGGGVLKQHLSKKDEGHESEFILFNHHVFFFFFGPFSNRNFQPNSTHLDHRRTPCNPPIGCNSIGATPFSNESFKSKTTQCVGKENGNSRNSKS